MASKWLWLNTPTLRHWSMYLIYVTLFTIIRNRIVICSRKKESSPRTLQRADSRDMRCEHSRQRCRRKVILIIITEVCGDWREITGWFLELDIYLYGCTQSVSHRTTSSSWQCNIISCHYLPVGNGGKRPFTGTLYNFIIPHNHRAEGKLRTLFEGKSGKTKLLGCSQSVPTCSASFEILKSTVPRSSKYAEGRERTMLCCRPKVDPLLWVFISGTSYCILWKYGPRLLVTFAQNNN